MADGDVTMQPEEFNGAGADVAAEEDDFEFDSLDAKVGEEIKLTKDGGVIKKIITKGDGWEMPEKGDEVTVHYTGTLEDGTKFDSSVDRGDPFKFKLGQGSVIKGWDTGVATMKKGEKSLLICRADYAYGASGSPPKIPPNATLHFEVELISWKSEKDITSDGGVIKTTTKEGDGWEHPKPRDEVTVKYQIRVKDSGAAVASTPEAGTSFPLSEARPLRAFHSALPLMKRGEVASLLVRSDYGYAEAERPADVPADATLEADLELVDWNTVEDVTDDGAVVKKTLKKAEGWKKPNLGAKVQVHLTGRLQDGTVFEDQDLEFTTDEEQVPEGLDLAVQKMKEGEVAEVTIPPQYAFGGSEARRPGGVVPPDSTVVYTVELKHLENAKESWSMTDEEKVEAGRQRKEKGNARFKASKWAAALKAYKSAEDVVGQDANFSADLKAAAREVQKGARLNSAACHLKLGNNRDAISSTTKVLEKDGSNVKALYRRAQAYLALGDFVECESDIRKALAEEPGNIGVRQLYKQYKAKAAESNKRDKAIFSKMFRKPLFDDVQVPAPSPAAHGTAAADTQKGAAAGGAAEAAPMDTDEVNAKTPAAASEGVTAAV